MVHLDLNDPKNIKSGQGRQFTGDEAMVGDPRKPLPDAKKPSNVKLEEIEKIELRKQKKDTTN